MPSARIFSTFAGYPSMTVTLWPARARLALRYIPTAPPPTKPKFVPKENKLPAVDDSHEIAFAFPIVLSLEPQTLEAWQRTTLELIPQSLSSTSKRGT